MKVLVYYYDFYDYINVKKLDTLEMERFAILQSKQLLYNKLP